jgi:hypothetical protein
VKELQQQKSKGIAEWQKKHDFWMGDVRSGDEMLRANGQESKCGN